MTNRIRITLVSISSLLVLYVFLGGLLGKSDSNSEKTYRDLGVYSEVLNRINLDYVTEPDLKKVTDGAIRGLLRPWTLTARTSRPPSIKPTRSIRTQARPVSAFTSPNEAATSLWSPCCRAARRRKLAYGLAT